MNKYIFSVIVTLLAVVASPQVVLAHTLETDGPIGAVIHITPEDNPVVGATSTFSFAVKDKESKFTPAGCACEGVVLKDGKEIFRQAATALDSNNSSDVTFGYAFPSKGKFQVQLVGVPLNPGGFSAFRLTWDIDVSREGGSSARTAANRPTPFVLYAIPFISLCLIAYQFVKHARKK